MPATDPTDDRCPGALRLHAAADGALVRIRLPGGQLSAPQLGTLARSARDHAAGTLDLTSRGNVQIRGIPDETAAAHIADRIAQAGLLPSASHERVRNIVASPLSGRDDVGVLDVRPLVRDLDVALRGTPDLSRLSGRFLFALDDGRDDVAGLGADLCWRAGVDSLMVGGTDQGLRVGPAGAVGALIRAAQAFLWLRGDRRELWRVRDLPGGPAALAAELADLAGLASVSGLAGRVAHPAHPVPPAGDGPRLGTHHGTSIVAAARLGRLSADQAELLSDTADDEGLVITPWRSVILGSTDPGVVPRLADAGLLVDPASAWVGVSACVGRPGCVSSLADVRADATAALTERTDQRRVHWVGCERACGRPVGPALLMVATGDGYVAKERD